MPVCAIPACRVMTDASLCGDAVLRSAAAMTPGGTDEEDLFFTRAVLQTLTSAPAGRDASAVQSRKEKACSALPAPPHALSRHCNASSWLQPRSRPVSKVCAG